MFRITVVVLFFVISFLELSLSLVELPKVEENAIFQAEAAIRGTANLLFSKLRIKEKYFKSPVKQYFIAHNYFIGITLQDYVNLKEIARLTRVDNNDEVTEYMDILNEILNENTDSTDRKILHDEKVLNTIQNLLNELTYVNGQNNTQAKEFSSEILPQIVQQNNNWEEENEIGTLMDDYDEVSNETSFESEVWMPEPNTRRIFQGRMTKIKHFPYMAVILLFNQFYCAGSIIDKDLVITAASCVQLAWNNRFFRENPAFLSVRVGSTFYAGGGEVINIQEVYFHPTYNPKNLKDNICILRLARNLKLKKRGKNIRRVQTIDFDRSASSLAITTAGITILGWGARDSSNLVKGAWTNRLSYSVLDVYPHHDCQDVYSKEYVGPKTFCAGYTSKGSGACNRDVGGPGIVDDILVGIISFGSAVCGVPDYPTVFIKVGFYADWIEDIMEMDVVVPTKQVRTTMSTTYSYTSAVNMETTTLIMKPIGDPGLVYIDSEQQDEVLRNRIPEDEVEHISNESTEISISSNNTDFNDLVFTTITITETPTTTPIVSIEDSSQVTERTKKIKRMRKKKKEFLEDKPQNEIATEDFLIKDLDLEQRGQQYTESNTEADTTTVASQATEGDNNLKEFLRKKKRPRKKKTKKTRKALTTTTKMNLHEKRVTPNTVQQLPLTIHPITNAQAGKTNELLSNNNDTALAPADAINNPLDTFTQKEFFALLTEVLDKLERDTSKQT